MHGPFTGIRGAIEVDACGCFLIGRVDGIFQRQAALGHALAGITVADDVSGVAGDTTTHVLWPMACRQASHTVSATSEGAAGPRRRWTYPSSQRPHSARGLGPPVATVTACQTASARLAIHARWSPNLPAVPTVLLHTPDPRVVGTFQDKQGRSKHHCREGILALPDIYPTGEYGARWGTVNTRKNRVHGPRSLHHPAEGTTERRGQCKPSVTLHPR